MCLIHGIPCKNDVSWIILRLGVWKQLSLGRCVVKVGGQGGNPATRSPRFGWWNTLGFSTILPSTNPLNRWWTSGAICSKWNHSIHCPLRDQKRPGMALQACFLVGKICQNMPEPLKFGAKRQGFLQFFPYTHPLRVDPLTSLTPVQSCWSTCPAQSAMVSDTD